MEVGGSTCVQGLEARCRLQEASNQHLPQRIPLPLPQQCGLLRPPNTHLPLVKLTASPGSGHRGFLSLPTTHPCEGPEQLSPR